MKTRIIMLTLLVCLILSMPVAALTNQDISDYNVTPMAIAWRENNEIFVAIVNENTSRQGYTVEIYDTQRRASLFKEDFIIPGRTILIEKIQPRTTGNARFPIEEVTIFTGYRGRTIKIQDSPLFTVNNYIVPANTFIEVDVDLLGIRANETYGRIEVDNNYEMYNGRGTGQISLTYEPGYNYIYRTTIEYSPPHLSLSMRTPNIRGVDILSFGLRHRPSGSWRDQSVLGPVYLVYGRDYSLADNSSGRSSSDNSSGWVTR